MTEYQSFYDQNRRETYAHAFRLDRAADHPRYADLVSFIRQFGLEHKTCLEIGSSHGFFQDMVDDYWGTDIAESLAQFYHKPIESPQVHTIRSRTRCSMQSGRSLYMNTSLIYSKRSWKLGGC